MPTLKKVLRDLLNAAAVQPGVLQPHRLEGGLRLVVKIDDGKTYLKVGRDRSYPSESEWDTVMRSLPYYAPLKNPQGKGVGADTRRWLWAMWATPGQLALGDEGRRMKDEGEAETERETHPQQADAAAAGRPALLADDGADGRAAVLAEPQEREADRGADAG